ncbi:hypothetical protein CKAH01_02567 [Colletotrichum kahawae]|uniref:Uncharacterized protein n=1 Tax=Colletotrichum kahawae TaxID=34407 RepID=A0AAD9XY64_COLKA|nr:hypothetical protein CKAH01_02567 [Colletotrichum kahawae]
MRLALLLTLLASVTGVAVAKPEKIRGDKTVPVLGPEASAESFNIAGSIRSANSSSYLNIGSDTTSYKSLKFSNASETTAWGLEGDTIITTQGSTWGRRELALVLSSSLLLLHHCGFVMC